MAAIRLAVDQTHFNDFSPLDRLSPGSIEELMADSRVERVPPGRRLFSKGDTDGELVFLLSGQLALIADGPAGTLKADAPEARLPVADHQPRRHTVVARTSATVLCVNSAVLDSLLRQGEAGADETPPAERDAPAEDPPAGDTDTAADILRSPLIAGLPPVHLRVLKARMSRLELAQGETLVRQGEGCRYFHVIESGRFKACRRRAKGAGIELLPGDSFGEDALVANEPHDATVTALEDGGALRLPREEFLTLVARHYVRWIAYRELGEALAEGAVLLDIRAPAAFRRHHLQGSVNFPLPLLQGAAVALDPSRRYVLCSDSTRRCAAAAFLLARHGVKTRILIEGVKAALSPE